MHSKTEPLSKAEIAALGAKRDIGNEVLQSIREEGNLLLCRSGARQAHDAHEKKPSTTCHDGTYKSPTQVNAEWGTVRPRPYAREVNVSTADKCRWWCARSISSMAPSLFVQLPQCCQINRAWF